MNALTEHAHHWIGGRKVGSQQDRDGRRMESILTGDRDAMKRVALTNALALANQAARQRSIASRPGVHPGRVGSGTPRQGGGSAP